MLLLKAIGIGSFFSLKKERIMKITLEIDDERFEDKLVSAIAKEVVAGLSKRNDSQIKSEIRKIARENVKEIVSASMEAVEGYLRDYARQAINKRLS